MGEPRWGFSLSLMVEVIIEPSACTACYGWLLDWLQPHALQCVSARLFLLIAAPSAATMT